MDNSSRGQNTGRRRGSRQPYIESVPSFVSDLDDDEPVDPYVEADLPSGPNIRDPSGHHTMRSPALPTVSPPDYSGSNHPSNRFRGPHWRNAVGASAYVQPPPSTVLPDVLNEDSIPPQPVPYRSTRHHSMTPGSPARAEMPFRTQGASYGGGYPQPYFGASRPGPAMQSQNTNTMFPGTHADTQRYPDPYMRPATSMPRAYGPFQPPQVRGLSGTDDSAYDPRTLAARFDRRSTPQPTSNAFGQAPSTHYPQTPQAQAQVPAYPVEPWSQPQASYTEWDRSIAMNVRRGIDDRPSVFTAIIPSSLSHMINGDGRDTLDRVRVTSAAYCRRGEQPSPYQDDLVVGQTGRIAIAAKEWIRDNFKDSDGLSPHHSQPSGQDPNPTEEWLESQMELLATKSLRAACQNGLGTTFVRTVRESELGKLEHSHRELSGTNTTHTWEIGKGRFVKR
ncbi:hypothetical protein IAR55_001084 [Kwoniella newhampshirensis]|uniref:Uncharacterized protein n=1 Tax=Kwoniella newhampshirensis TaxID=1651941 RepID=A0AAW0Z4U0_9TREE